MSKLERGTDGGEQTRGETGTDQHPDRTPLFYPAELHTRNAKARRAMAKSLEASGLSAKGAARVLHLPVEE